MPSVYYIPISNLLHATHICYASHVTFSQKFLNYQSFIPSNLIFIQVKQHSSVMSELSSVAITTFLSILILADIVGNALVCAIIKKNRDMRYADILSVILY